MVDNAKPSKNPNTLRFLLVTREQIWQQQNFYNQLKTMFFYIFPLIIRKIEVFA